MFVIKEQLEEDLELKEKQLDEMRVQNNEMIKNMEEEHSRDSIRYTVQEKRLEGAAGTLETKNPELRKEL